MRFKQRLTQILDFTSSVQTKYHIDRSILIFWSPLVLGFFIALLSPEDILDKCSYIQEVTSWLKTIFPPIAGYAEKSKFPQISEIYFSFMWVFSPYYFWLGVQLVRNNEGLRNWKPKTFGEQIRIFLIGVVLVSLLGYFTLFINPGYDFNLLPVNSSRFVLAISGYALSGSAGAWLLAIAYCFLEKIFFRK